MPNSSPLRPVHTLVPPRGSSPWLLYGGAEPIRHRTMVTLRWVGLVGQASSVLVGALLGVKFPVVLAIVVILAAALVNLGLSLRKPRLNTRQTLAQLMFDTVQTGALLSLTGGSANPFALFVLAPLTLGATVLPRRFLVALAATTTVMIMAMTLTPISLELAPNAALTLGAALGIGHVLALVIGGTFFALSAYLVSSELAATENALLATRLGLEREHRLQHLGGVVAAAAHEMGTPLATIKLVASELADELSDRPDVADDLALLKSSADRCRDILRSMGSAGKDDLHLRKAPLADVLSEAAAPHRGRGARIEIDEPTGLIVHRDAGLIHAMRNLIQNAVDFADKLVRVEARIADGQLIVTVRDDGKGYPDNLLDRLGEPYLTTRMTGTDSAAKYEGMGLGLFIGRTLLERSGGRLRFYNDEGAVALVSWPLATIQADDREILSQNPSISE